MLRPEDSRAGTASVTLIAQALELTASGRPKLFPDEAELASLHKVANLLTCPLQIIVGIERTLIQGLQYTSCHVDAYNGAWLAINLPGPSNSTLYMTASHLR